MAKKKRKPRRNQQRCARWSPTAVEREMNDEILRILHGAIDDLKVLGAPLVDLCDLSSSHLQILARNWFNRLSINQALYRVEMVATFMECAGLLDDAMRDAVFGESEERPFELELSA